MWVVEIDLISMEGIKIDLISVSGSELTWFFCGRRKMLGVSIWIGIHLDFEWGRKLLAFSVCIGNN